MVIDIQHNRGILIKCFTWNISKRTSVKHKIDTIFSMNKKIGLLYYERKCFMFHVKHFFALQEIAFL